MLEKLCKQEGVDFGEKPFEAVAEQFQSANVDDLFANIGASLQSPRDVFYAAFSKLRPKPAEKTAALSEEGVPIPPKSKPRPAGAPLTLEGLIPGMAVHYARCCHPLPGDPIVGIVSTGRGVTIHTQDCKTLNPFRSSPERWVDVGWGEGYGKESIMVGRLSIVVTNEPNSLGALATIIGKSGGNITNFKIVDRATDFFDLLVDVEVRDTAHLMNIIAALRANTAINSVERTKGR
jgi:GTP pyrophosphokinase